MECIILYILYIIGFWLAMVGEGFLGVCAFILFLVYSRVELSTCHCDFDLDTSIEFQY
jgi:hypothetical protein